MFLLISAIAITAIAVFSKQSGIQLILIFGAFSLLIRDWKTLLKLTVISIILYGTLLLMFIFRYHAFLQNVIGGIANGISLENYTTMMLRNLILLSIWPLIFTSLFLIVKTNHILQGTITERLLAVCTLGTAVFATLTALKMGSTPQYYILFVNLALLFVMNHLDLYIRGATSTGQSGGKVQKIIFTAICPAV